MWVPPSERAVSATVDQSSMKTVAYSTTLRIITSTADELSSGTNIDNLEPKNTGFNEFFAILGCSAHLESKFSLKLLEIDQDNLRTKVY